ncbi:50S ribosomal protein L25 [uncultured Clostridium sp.]|uniref:50S ribosomal protein L25 n=1 Tax=uncultured Clostridium sp. TaxID=59620 RepID=UPI0008234747|nr:50S ribosomal protein L25 [uncultured Clostridium sp.]SCJ37725.1 50S ribosomal protein L25 [uncultured Clostridium sp.]
MSNIFYSVKKREAKSNNNSLRKNGQVPGIIYGEFLEKSIPITMKAPDLNKMLRSNNSGSIIEIDLDGEKFNCVVKDIQKGLLNEIIHFDLQYTKPSEVIKMKIPVKYIGQENLMTKRLLLDASTSFIEFQGPVEKIPEFIEVDVSSMNINDKIFIKDISIPSDVSVLDDPELLLGVINPASSAK